MATIRTMTAADYPVAAALANEAAHRGLVGRPLWETEADVAAEAEAPDAAAFLVAEDDTGTVAGLAGYHIGKDGEAELYGPLIATCGHGIGAYLESRVEALARLQGAETLSLLIGLQNRSGTAWAEWRGYQRDTEEPELLITWLYPGELAPAHLTPEALVRPATAADLPRIEDLFADCFPRERTQPADLLQACWVVEAGGQVEGFLQLERSAAWIRHLCVDPRARRRGLGATLLTGAVERFWAEEPRKVGLSVPLDDAAPVSLIRRLGFRREVQVAKWSKR